MVEIIHGGRRCSFCHSEVGREVLDVIDGGKYICKNCYYKNAPNSVKFFDREIVGLWERGRVGTPEWETAKARYEELCEFENRRDRALMAYEEQKEKEREMKEWRREEIRKEKAKLKEKETAKPKKKVSR